MHAKLRIAEASPVIDPEEANDKNFKMSSHCIIGMTSEGFFFYFTQGCKISFRQQWF